MAASIPPDEPATLRAGDTWKWTRTLSDYPASAWALKYGFKNASGGFQLTATAAGDDFSVSVPASSTASYAAGEYSWMAWVEAGGEKYTVDSGTLEVLPDYRTADAATALDDRSHARKVLAALEAWIEAREPAVAEYEIAGRRMKYHPLPELLRLRDKYRAEVAREDDANRIAAGLPTRRRLLVRFGGGT